MTWACAPELAARIATDPKIKCKAFRMSMPPCFHLSSPQRLTDLDQFPRWFVLPGCLLSQHWTIRQDFACLQCGPPPDPRGEDKASLWHDRVGQALDEEL